MWRATARPPDAAVGRPARSAHRYKGTALVAARLPTLAASTTLNADMKILCSLALLASLLSGCAVYTPSGAVIVDPHDGGGRGGFCPPGQAKKGNC